MEISKALYAPYHPRAMARRLYNVLKKDFGFDVIYKNTKNIGYIILRKGGHDQIALRDHVVYVQNPLCMRTVSKEICRTDNGNTQQMKQPTKKMVPKEVQDLETNPKMYKFKEA